MFLRHWASLTAAARRNRSTPRQQQLTVIDGRDQAARRRLDLHRWLSRLVDRGLRAYPANLYVLLSADFGRPLMLMNALRQRMIMRARLSDLRHIERALRSADPHNGPALIERLHKADSLGWGQLTQVCWRT